MAKFTHALLVQTTRITTSYNNCPWPPHITTIDTSIKATFANDLPVQITLITTSYNDCPWPPHITTTDTSIKAIFANDLLLQPVLNTISQEHHSCWLSMTTSYYNHWHQYQDYIYQRPSAPTHSNYHLSWVSVMTTVTDHLILQPLTSVPRLYMPLTFYSNLL